MATEVQVDLVDLHDVLQSLPEQDSWRQRLQPHRILHQAGVLTRNARNTVRHSCQLAARGWADSDAWSLDHVLCERLAAQLTYLADIAHGWPGTTEFPQPEDWDKALRDNAAKLKAWPNSADNPTSDLAHDQQAYKQSQEALHWVADHLGHLWD